MERIAYEFCEDQVASSVLYFEVRYSPHALCTENSAFPDQERVSPKAIVEAVNRGLKMRAEDFGVIARSILCCMRQMPDFSKEVVSLCQEFANDGVVGIDLAGDEPVWQAQAMEGHVIAYEEAKRLNIHGTVHAGEGGPAANVKIALDTLHAERIGHGYHVIQDAELYQRIVKENIFLEVCPTSSIPTGAVKPCFKTDPLRRFDEDGVNFSINSDDPLVCETRVDLEQGIAFDKIGLSPAELTRAMNSTEQNKCGDSTWRAAGNSLHKKRNLCETGLEIAGCRHSMAQKAVNMMYGEIYGYAHYLQKTYFIPKQVKYFWYDVVCKYWPWLKKNDGEVSEKMKPALSIMHAKAHSWSCQAFWGGRWQDGASATTGEEVEQINSHFSRLGTITKHMLPEGREELLTEHALQWNRKKVLQLPQALAKRYSRTKNQLTNARKALLGHLKMLQVTTDMLTGWKKDIHHAAQAEQNSQNSRKTIFTPKEEEFLTKLFNSDKDTLLPKHAVMCEAADQLNGQQYKQLLSRSNSAGDLAALGVADVETSGEGEKTLFDKVTAHLTKQTENFYFSISQIVYNMGKLGDSSKQRQRLRIKVSQEKGYLRDALNPYNELVSDDGKAKQEDIEKGEFPWQLFCDQFIGNVPIRTKKLVVNKKMEVERFQEELVLLKKEMIGFMSFYKDIILPSILEDKRQLQASLTEPESSDLEQDKVEGQESDDSSMKKLPSYATLTPTQSAKRGLLSLLEKGTDFALKQIAIGVNAFASVLSDELDAFRKLSLRSEEDGVIDPSDDTQKEECEEEEEGGEEEEDDERGLQIEALGNGDLEEFANILDELDELVPLRSVSLGEEVCAWKLPQQMCQSLFNLRNGSNACSLISLLIAYVLEKKNIQIPDQGVIPSYLVKILCGCIELGNRIYDNCRYSIPNRYLSIQEALTLLPFTSISVEEPLPVRLEDEHHLSTIWGQLDLWTGTSRNFVNIIIDEKTSLCLFHQVFYTLIRIHIHHMVLLL